MSSTYIFGFEQAGALAAFSALCAWACTIVPEKRVYKKYFPDNADDSMLLIYLMYNGLLHTVLLTVVLFYFFSNTVADTWQYIVGVVMLFLHLFLVKVRNTLFWKAQMPELAFTVSILAALPAVGYFITLINNHEHLYLVHTITFACYLVFAWGVVTFGYILRSFYNPKPNENTKAAIMRQTYVVPRDLLRRYRR